MRRFFALTVALACMTRGTFARAADDAEPKFPHVIQFELGASGFLPGDAITITSLRGDRKHIEPGGSYLVEGTYTLAADDKAALCLFCTTRGKSGPTPVSDGQRARITRGTGKFHLYETNLADGWLHVSFYPHNSSSHGGVYFGEKGRENTIMRNQDWFSNISRKSTGQQQGETGQWHQALTDYNHALLSFLGSPVVPPTDMDAKYTRQGLSNAVEQAARNAGIALKKLEIDDGEFPFLVGTICAGSDFARLKAEIKKMDGYQYGGSVGNDANSDGSDTCNAFSIVPYEAYPADARKQIGHRLMVRYEFFYDRLSEGK